MDVATLNSLVTQIHEAGGFGDGVETESLEQLAATLLLPNATESARLAASLAIVNALASAADNSTWSDAQSWKSAKLVRKLFSTGAIVASCRPAVYAFFESEAQFTSEANILFRNVVLPIASGMPPNTSFERTREG